MEERSGGSTLKEAIILAGGWAKRLKPEVMTPKPFLTFKDQTLLELQLEWLLAHDFEHVVVAINEQDYKYMLKHHSYLAKTDDFTFSIEKERLGTGGAVKQALQYTTARVLYVMNVDDIVDYDPNELLENLGRGGTILVQQTRLPYGVVYFDYKNEVLRFEEKPFTSYWVSCGHYALKRRVIKKYFPEKGDLELCVWQDMARDHLLKVYKLRGRWVTINTYKDYEKVLKELE